MLLLNSTSDIVRVVTASAVSTITVDAAWMVYNAGTITPNSLVTNITTATTTTIATAPATGSDEHNVLSITIANNHASSSCAITVQKFNGTIAADLIAVTLLAGETLMMLENGEWQHRDTQGALYFYNGPQAVNQGIVGTLSETMPRETCVETNSTVSASGTLNMMAIYLWAGQLVSNISISSATTAAGTPTNYRFGLFDSSRNLLAESANQTTSAWAANTVKTLAMGTPYRVPTSGLYYIGYYMTATTVPTLKGFTAKTGAQLAGTAPILHGSSTTGLTTAFPNPAAAITVSTWTFWAAVT
jgi:hypothetical protein